MDKKKREMEKYVALLGVCLLVGWLLLALVGHVVMMWRKARKEQKDMGRLKAGSVWRLRSNIIRNDPFAEDARHLVTVLETRANSDGRLWVRYKHKSGLVETDPVDMFVHLYIYVEGPPIKVYATAEEFRERIKSKNPSPTLPSMGGRRGRERTENLNKKENGDI